jgi:hypothetical protein
VRRTAAAGLALVALFAAVPPSPARADLLDGDAVTLQSGQVARQVVAAAPGGQYSVSTNVVAAGDGKVEVRVTFYDAGLAGLPGQAVSDRSSPFTGTISVGAQAPGGTAFVEVAVRALGSAQATVSGTTLTGPPGSTPTQPPAATATVPTPRPTTTPTATATPTPTAPPGTVTPGASQPPATGTVNPTATAMPTVTPTATQSPTPPPPMPSSAPPAPSGFGGLLSNGDFEAAVNGAPLSWHEFGGGDLRASGPSYRGAFAARLGAAAGTTWVHQAAGVSGGAWYVGRAWAAVESGSAETWVRLSWYASSDGSGPMLGQADGPVHSGGWQLISTGPVLAPVEARSVRFRLMVRSGGGAVVAFDDAELLATVAPPPTPTPGGAPARTAVPVRSPTGGGSAPPVPGTPVATAAHVTLRISEVMADPEEGGRDGPFEWVELVNTGTEPVDLAGWKLGDAVSSDALPTTVVPPGGYVVVAGREARFADGILLVRVPDGEIGNSLNNAGDALYLIAPDGTTVDAMSFGTNTAVFASPPPAAPAGQTLGLRGPGASPAATEWSVTLAPSPGRPNSFAPEPTPTILRTTATGTPGVSGSPRDATEPGRAPAGAPTVAPPPSDGGGSATPALIGAAVVGAGLAGAAMLGRQAWPGLRERVRRRGR